MATEKRTQAKQGKPTKIVLVDDHPMVREGLRESLCREPDLTVCGEAEDRFHALEIIESTRPDVAIVDLSLKNSSGLELIKDITARYPGVVVLVVSMHDESLYAERVIRAGARGYITKQQACKSVVAAIRKLLAGEFVGSDTLAQIALAQLSGRNAATQDAGAQKLSDRELDVLGMIGDGFNSRQIAERLHLDVSTVETYRARIKEKLNLKDATELLQYAIRWKRLG